MATFVTDPVPDPADFQPSYQSLSLMCGPPNSAEPNEPLHRPSLRSRYAHLANVNQRTVAAWLWTVWQGTIEHPLNTELVPELAVVVTPGLNAERCGDATAVGELVEQFGRLLSVIKHDEVT